MAIKRMGYHGELVAHGLRSIASTAMNEHGLDAELIETCLAHVDKIKSGWHTTGRSTSNEGGLSCNGGVKL